MVCVHTYFTQTINVGDIPAHFTYAHALLSVFYYFFSQLYASEPFFFFNTQHEISFDGLREIKVDEFIPKLSLPQAFYFIFCIRMKIRINFAAFGKYTEHIQMGKINMYIFLSRIEIGETRFNLQPHSYYHFVYALALQ